MLQAVQFLKRAVVGRNCSKFLSDPRMECGTIPSMLSRFCCEDDDACCWGTMEAGAWPPSGCCRVDT